jgi:hypothetical protein
MTTQATVIQGTAREIREALALRDFQRIKYPTKK